MSHNVAKLKTKTFVFDKLYRRHSTLHQLLKMNLDSFKSLLKSKTLTLPTSKSKSNFHSRPYQPKFNCNQNQKAKIPDNTDREKDGCTIIYENINFTPISLKCPPPQPPAQSIAKNTNNLTCDYSNYSNADILLNLLDKSSRVDVEAPGITNWESLRIERGKKAEELKLRTGITDPDAEQIQTKDKKQTTYAIRQQDRGEGRRRRRFGSMPVQRIEIETIETIESAQSSVGIGEEAEVEVELGKVTINTKTTSNITQIRPADRRTRTNAHWQMEDTDSQEVKISSDHHQHQDQQEHGSGNENTTNSTNNRNSLSPNFLAFAFEWFDAETQEAPADITAESLTPEAHPDHTSENLYNSVSNNSENSDTELAPNPNSVTTTPSLVGNEEKEESDKKSNLNCEQDPAVSDSNIMYKINSIRIQSTATTAQTKSETVTVSDQVRDVLVTAEREDEEKLFRNHVLCPKLVISSTSSTYPNNNSSNLPEPMSEVPTTSLCLTDSTVTSSTAATSSIYSNFNNALETSTSTSSSTSQQCQSQMNKYKYENIIHEFQGEIPLQVPLRRNKVEQQKQLLLLQSESESDYEKEKTSISPNPPNQNRGHNNHEQDRDTEEVIRSVNGVTTIEIKPIHHIIDISPQKAEEIKRNRLQYKKSSRLSQFMSSEFKLDAPMANSLNVHRARSMGSAVKRKFGDWVRRIHDEEEKTKSQGNLNEFQDEDAQGQNEFEDLRRLVKQGGDFCKDLSAVLQERSELEATYSKGLAKLSSKLLKASKEATGSVAHAWQAVAVHIDTQAELHRLWSVSLQEEVARPLKTSTETQSKIRKSVEVLVDKTTRNLAEWRMAEAKAKRQCFSCSKEFEKLQESNPSSEVRSRLLSVPPSDPIKLESKKRKAEETVRRADIEYYTFCVRSERARLEWESSIRNGSTCLRTLEEEKLTLLKDLAYKYFHAMSDLMPKLMRSTEVLEEPIKTCNVEQDMQTIVVRRHAGSEQLLPDFYAEDTSNLMKKDRRSEALQKCLFLIKQDLDRERKGTVGVENLAKAIADAPKIDNSHHDISDKLYYMKSMLLYLEAARIKLDITLADVEGRQKPSSAIIQYMRHQRDKQGLPQTILKVPSWARDDCLTPNNDSPDWSNEDRNIQLNHVNQLNHADHDTDFDEFSSEAGSSDNVYEEDKDSVPSIGKCRVLYDYDKNLFDELTIRAGDLINVHDKQEDGWWLGELKGIVGIFPATYVEEMESSE